MSTHPVSIIGGGLAGSEAAWQLVLRGIPVELFEMRPVKKTPTHKTSGLAELVCSNSFKSKDLTKASGLLKQEMTSMGSLIMEAGEIAKVEAGNALAVDRDIFSQFITEKLSNHPLCTIKREEVTNIPDDRIALISTGPLTSEALFKSLGEKISADNLYFYDAISPIIETDSIDMDHCFKASRYDKGSDYLNIPLDKKQYYDFIKDLITAEKIKFSEFEKEIYFEGCLPIEVMAERGAQTLSFGPMKPVGLVDPKTNQRPYACIQLRAENKQATLYNIVGFQTKLTYGEQVRIFKKFPALAQAKFARLGSIHRNAYIHGPKNLTKSLQLKKHPLIFLAGQITGVEGYMDSTAMGLLAGINIAHFIKDITLAPPKNTTALGALIHYITEYPHKNYQPMNINFGLFPPLAIKTKKAQKIDLMVERAQIDLLAWKNTVIPIS